MQGALRCHGTPATTGEGGYMPTANNGGGQVRRTVATPSGTIAYTDRGAGPIALFVHGVFLNADLWDGVIDGLTDVRRCIAPDLLCHGGTIERAGADVSFAGQAQALVELIDALGIDRVDLVGNDSGGGIAQIMAARH